MHQLNNADVKDNIGNLSHNHCQLNNELARLPFNLNKFLFRYIAGDNCLRDSRKISRKRLSLVSSGIPTTDKDAFLLHLQIEKFQLAYENLKKQKKISISSLCDTNKLVASTNINAGKIRTHQNWIGAKMSSISEAKFIPPPPESIISLLDELIEFINKDNVSISKANEAHSRLLLIHPFNDGNGRTARILWQIIAERSNQYATSPSLYRLNNSDAPYIEATTTFGIDEAIGRTHQFWNECELWGNSYLQKISSLAKATELKIRTKKCISILSKNAEETIKYAWNNPVIYPKKLKEILKADSLETNRTLEELVKLKILEPRPVHYPCGDFIFECSEIMNFFITIENEIFINH